MYCYGGYFPIVIIVIPNMETLHSTISVHRTLWDIICYQQMGSQVHKLPTLGYLEPRDLAWPQGALHSGCQGTPTAGKVTKRARRFSIAARSQPVQKLEIPYSAHPAKTVSKPTPLNPEYLDL